MVVLLPEAGDSTRIVLEDGEEAYEPAAELRIEESDFDAEEEPDSPHENALVNLSGSRMERLTNLSSLESRTCLGIW